MTNRDRVEQIARKLGFEIFYPEEHPVTEQIRAYQEASTIAGEYGSGLHNSMFAPPGECVVVGLAPTQLLQSRLSALTQHPTGYIYPEHSVQHDWRTIYGVAEHDVERGLEAAIGR
jgi:capsular polysaccharide biosynthesis protein